MTKAELRNKCEALEKLADDIQADCTDMFEEVQKMRLQIAYQDGILKGLGFTDQENTSRDAEIDFEAIHQDEMDERGLDCDCPVCEVPDRKRKNLLDSSADIRKWADENDVDIDPGDPNDN